MKAEDSRQVNTRTEEPARIAGGAGLGAEADVTTRLRTKAELEQAGKLMDAVCERGNLKLAYQRVVENKGAAGVDGIGVAEFKDRRTVVDMDLEKFFDRVNHDLLMEKRYRRRSTTGKYFASFAGTSKRA